MTHSALPIKICGLTRQEDARLACELGAWAIGLIFAPQSPRRLSGEAAAALVRALPAEVEKVGVFVDSPLSEVQALREQVGLSIVQLHGQEDPAYVQALGGRVIKAIRPRTLSDLEVLKSYQGVEAFLIDGARSGERVDPELVKAAKAFGPVILAGGLNAENVTEAIAATQPFAIDLSSGIEASPGVKDAQKMRALFSRVRAREESAS